MSQKIEPTLASCSFVKVKHGLILIILGKHISPLSETISVFNFPCLFIFAYFITRHSLIRAKGEVLVLLYVFCSVNDFSTTRGPIYAKVCMRAYLLWFQMCDDASLLRQAANKHVQYLYVGFSRRNKIPRVAVHTILEKVIRFHRSGIRTVIRIGLKS